MNKEKFKNLIYLFILIQPLLDLVTSLMTRYTNVITLGIIVKGLILLLLIIYVLFFNKSKYKKISISYFVLLGIFVLFYLITKEDILNFNILKQELIILFKFLFYPIFFIGILNLYDQYKLDKKKISNILAIDFIMFSVLITIPTILNISFKTYVGNKVGSIGWFYSGNEISAITCILFPYLWIKIDNNFNLKNIIYIILAIGISIYIGTKTAYLLALFPSILLFIYYLINKKFKYMIVPFLIVLALIAIYPISPLKQNMIENTKEATVTKGNSSLYKFLSGRDELLSDTASIYFNSNDVNKLFGIGVTNRSDINNEQITKFIEMDIFDILFRLGLIGAFIYFLPIIVILLLVFEYVIKQKFKLKEKEYLILFSFFIGILAAIITGHVLVSPGVSIYLAISTLFTLLIIKEHS